MAAEQVTVSQVGNLEQTPPEDDESKAIAAKSKVHQSIIEKGENSYYFAHSGKKDDLSSAKTIEGDGSRTLASLDGMKKLDSKEIEVDRNVSWREDYAWGDEGSKVKVYLDFPEGALGHPEVKVEQQYSDFNFEVVIRNLGGSGESVGVTNGNHKLSGKIVPEKCSWRFNSSKTRLTVTLVKADSAEGAWSTMKKHVISQHTGWN